MSKIVMNFMRSGSVILLLLAITNPASAVQLAGSEWRPTEITGDTIPDASNMFVRFGSENKIFGHGGCNRFTGSVNINGGRIEITLLAVTQANCLDPIMKREARFLQALSNTKRFERNRINLSLTDQAGNIIVKFIQTDAD